MNRLSRMMLGLLFVVACGRAPGGPQSNTGFGEGGSPASSTGTTSGYSGSGGGTGAPGGGSSSGTGGSSAGTGGSSAATGGGSAVTGGGAASGGGTPQPQAGQLTAGLWDDNFNFTHFQNFRATQGVNANMFTVEEQTAASQLAAGPRQPRTTVDIAIVLDTTGSMGDEIKYLQAEVAAISTQIASLRPNATQRWALVAYRDVGDEYVLRATDFTSAELFRDALAAESAKGGGDFPEAPDQALSRASTLSWSQDPSVAKLIFWVADAPPHADKYADLAGAVRTLRNQNIRIYPVASSGIDEFTEYIMRASAQLTLGRYLFLTDDSGIGGAHKEPSIPCYVVTTLYSAMTRVVNAELTGTYIPAAQSEIIRSVGSPVDGVCSGANQVSYKIF